jgi:predicted metal-dependent phosphoesterase TrpH
MWFAGPSPGDREGKYTMLFDLHVHTTRYSRDSRLDPIVMVHRAMKIGLDGVVITEHDAFWTESELGDLRAAAPGLIVLAGMEVSTREGHFLAYGIKEPGEITPFMRVTDLCREMHRQGGVVVAAHPFRSGQLFDKVLQLRPDLDGIELISGRMNENCRQLAAQVFRPEEWAGLGSSDAHHEDNLGCCHTEFDAEIRNIRDLVIAIRQHKTVPCEGLPMAVA